MISIQVWHEPWIFVLWLGVRQVLGSASRTMENCPHQLQFRVQSRRQVHCHHFQQPIQRQSQSTENILREGTRKWLVFGIEVGILRHPVHFYRIHVFQEVLIHWSWPHLHLHARKGMADMMSHMLPHHCVIMRTARWLDTRVCYTLSSCPLFNAPSLFDILSYFPLAFVLDLCTFKFYFLELLSAQRILHKAKAQSPCTQCFVRHGNEEEALFVRNLIERRRIEKKEPPVGIEPTTFASNCSSLDSIGKQRTTIVLRRLKSGHRVLINIPFIFLSVPSVCPVGQDDRVGP